MSILLALIPISLILLGIAVAAFVWAVKRGQFDDMDTPALDILRMATFEGARAFGFANKGMIREGWMADLVLVDLDQPHYVGVDEENLAVYIVYAGSSADVKGTMVNGKWLYRDGAYPTLDRDEIVRKAREARKAITE